MWQADAAFGAVAVVAGVKVLTESRQAVRDLST